MEPIQFKSLAELAEHIRTNPFKLSDEGLAKILEDAFRQQFEILLSDYRSQPGGGFKVVNIQCLDPSGKQLWAHSGADQAISHIGLTPNALTLYTFNRPEASAETPAEGQGMEDAPGV